MPAWATGTRGDGATGVDAGPQPFRLELRAGAREGFYEGPFGPLRAGFDERGALVEGDGLDARLDWAPLEAGERRWKTENERLKAGVPATVNGRGYVLRRPGSGWGRGGSAPRRGPGRDGGRRQLRSVVDRPRTPWFSTSRSDAIKAAPARDPRRLAGELVAAIDGGRPRVRS